MVKSKTEESKEPESKEIKSEKTEKVEKTESKKPDWVKTKPAELEKLVLELAKQGETPAKIGLILRDKHGIPKAKLIGKKISQILKEANIKFKTEKEALNEKIEVLNKHIEKHKHDYTAGKSVTKKLWTIQKLQ